MKKTVIEQPTLCYRDEAFENQTRQQLETARQSLVNLLTEWQKLEICDCADLHELLLRPENALKRSIDKTVKIPIPEGKFGMNKEKYLANLDLPDSTRLIQAAKAAQRQPFAAVEPLWKIVENDVQLIEEEATSLIESQNIYLSDERQIKFVNRINEMVDAMNEVDQALNGILLAPPMIRQGLLGKFQLVERDPYRYKIAIIPAVLRQWLNEIN